MDYYWNLIAVAIGYYYARKNGRLAMAKIHKYDTGKKSKTIQNKTL